MTRDEHRVECLACGDMVPRLYAERLPLPPSGQIRPTGCESQPPRHWFYPGVRFITLIPHEAAELASWSAKAQTAQAQVDTLWAAIKAQPTTRIPLEPVGSCQTFTWQEDVPDGAVLLVDGVPVRGWERREANPRQITMQSPPSAGSKVWLHVPLQGE